MSFFVLSYTDLNSFVVQLWNAFYVCPYRFCLCLDSFYQVSTILLGFFLRYYFMLSSLYSLLLYRATFKYSEELSDLLLLMTLLSCYHLSQLHLLLLIIFFPLLRLHIFISEISFICCRWTIKLCWLVFRCIPYSYQIILRCPEKIVDFFYLYCTNMIFYATYIRWYYSYVICGNSVLP